MKVAVFGLGYTGTVLAGCLADAGHSVTGVDVAAGKVDAIRAGHAPMKEPGLGDLVRDVVGRGLLTATDSVDEALDAVDVAAVCVGTPSSLDGGIDASAVERVVMHIAGVGSRDDRQRRHMTVAIRSTLLPGTTRQLFRRIESVHPGFAAGGHFSLAVWPEFLREGRALEDFHNPSLTLVGHESPRAVAAIAALLGRRTESIHGMSFEAAEAAKIACNAFHAAKVTFANEIGRYCDAVGADGHHVMRLLAADHRLNSSAAYLQPGYAFGGSCLPKDVRAIVAHSRRAGVRLPMLEQILPSNALQIGHLIEYVRAHGWRRIAIIGIAFKAFTDDLRESPFVSLARGLMESGIQVSVYDQTVDIDRLSGENRAFVERELPALARLVMPSVEEAVLHADAVVIGSHDPREVRRVTPAGVAIVDPRIGYGAKVVVEEDRSDALGSDALG